MICVTAYGRFREGCDGLPCEGPLMVLRSSHRWQRCHALLMKRFFSILALNAFFLGIMLPCCMMQHSSTLGHTVAPSDMHEHVHAHATEPFSDESSSGDSRQELCCYDSLLVAFYGLSGAGKSLLTETTGSQIQAKALLPLFVTAPIPHYLAGRFDRLRSFPLAASLLPSPLYRQRTLLLL